MNSKFLLLFSVLILVTIGHSNNAFATDYTQICIDKVWIEKTNNKIACVTPSTADKLVERGWGTILEISMEEPIEEELPLGVQIIETKKGNITIDHDYLTPESAQLLSDELFFQHQYRFQ